jgi:hypothetical protein
MMKRRIRLIKALIHYHHRNGNPEVMEELRRKIAARNQYTSK